MEKLLIVQMPRTSPSRTTASAPFSPGNAATAGGATLTHRTAARLDEITSVPTRARERCRAIPQQDRPDDDQVPAFHPSSRTSLGGFAGPVPRLATPQVQSLPWQACRP